MGSQAILMLIIELVDLIATGMEWYAEDRARYAALRTEIKRFIEEGREPTAEEIAALLTESRDLSVRIREAIRRRQEEA